MEKEITVIPGIFVALIQLLLVGFSLYYTYENWETIEEIGTWIIPCFCILDTLVLFGGYVILEPNEVAIISFMGVYKGTLKTNGFVFINPFYSSKIWSLKVSNYAMETLEVNDKNGVPIEIAAIIVWKIGDTYKAQYDVEDLTEYIDNQFEISLRKLAKEHSYAELSGEDRDFIADLTDKVSKTGVIILDAKITHLTYASEIVGVMLQKQQAEALSEAKEIIVKNAVEIAESAAKNLMDLSSTEKSRFISNLIIVLCSEKAVSPVVNVG